MGRELQAGSRPPFRSLGILMLLACLIRPAQAQDLCGRLPVFDHTKVESTGSLILDFLKGFVGKGQVHGSVTSTSEDVLHLYPNADALLPRISVFVVECKLVEQDATLNAAQKRDEILRIYNLVFLQRNSLGHFGSPVRYASLGPHRRVTISDSDITHVAETAPRRPTIDDQIHAKETWRAQWFHESLDGPPPAGSPGSYHVIVASPCGEDAAQQAVTAYSTKYPEIYFELWRTVGKCYFAVTVGTGLTQDQARNLLAIVRRRGMNGYLWRW